MKLLDEWQVSHDMLVGRWFPGLDTGVMPAKLWPLWQLVQPPTMPVCFISVPAKVVKTLDEWQVSHAALVGRWFTGLDTGVTPAKA